MSNLTLISLLSLLSPGQGYRQLGSRDGRLNRGAPRRRPSVFLLLLLLFMCYVRLCVFLLFVLSQNVYQRYFPKDCHFSGGFLLEVSNGLFSGTLISV